jgi:hypothetical protein
MATSEKWQKLMFPKISVCFFCETCLLIRAIIVQAVLLRNDQCLHYDICAIALLAVIAQSV